MPQHAYGPKISMQLFEQRTQFCRISFSGLFFFISLCFYTWCILSSKLFFSWAETKYRYLYRYSQLWFLSLNRNSQPSHWRVEKILRKVYTAAQQGKRGCFIVMWIFPLNLKVKVYSHKCCGDIIINSWVGPSSSFWSWEVPLLGCKWHLML